jgi:hypothetical protein
MKNTRTDAAHLLVFGATVGLKEQTRNKSREIVELKEKTWNKSREKIALWSTGGVH